MTRSLLICLSVKPDADDQAAHVLSCLWLIQQSGANVSKAVLVDRCPYYDLTPDIGSPTSTLSAETAGSDDTSYFSNLASTTDTCAPLVSVLQIRPTSLSPALARTAAHTQTAVAAGPAAGQGMDLQHAWMSYTLITHKQLCADINFANSGLTL